MTSRFPGRVSTDQITPELRARAARFYERITGKNPRRAPGRVETLALALIVWGWADLDEDPPVKFHITSHYYWPQRACRTELERLAVHLGTATQGVAKRCMFVYPTRLPKPAPLASTPALELTPCST